MGRLFYLWLLAIHFVRSGTVSFQLYTLLFPLGLIETVDQSQARHTSVPMLYLPLSPLGDFPSLLSVRFLAQKEIQFFVMHILMLLWRTGPYCSILLLLELHPRRSGQRLAKRKRGSK